MAHDSLGQAGRPSGLIGRLFGTIMARHNAPDNAWTIGLLGIGEKDRILEVGFGPGVAIESLVRQFPTVHIDGIDHSRTMFQSAGARNRQAIVDGKVALQLGSVEELPFENETFDKVFAINCIYFWGSPVEGLKELYRVLKPGGRLAITVRDKHRDVYLDFRPDRLQEMFAQAGFEKATVHSNNLPSHPLFCALGVK